MMQNNLGAALKNQGIRLNGSESIRLLGEAVSAYRSAAWRSTLASNCRRPGQ